MDSEITLKMDGYISTCIIPEDENTSDEILSSFIGMMISHGFTVKQMRKAMDSVLAITLAE